MVTVDSTRDAQAAVHEQLPEAIRFQPILHGEQCIGWTYCTAPGRYGWILTTGRISAATAVSRETAAYNARTTHRP
ncbi:hypothetical protein [Kitasatospora cineracea]|uniref:hypothetical protein n=1 Tax=Kitasatospora cineracea TaxID=88074 RepID=UPI0036B16771